MGTKCNGCSAVIYDILYMECAKEKCNKIYHLKCLAMSVEQFNELTVEYKTTWVCPECIRAVPRGNNSETPVRGPIMDKTFTPSSSYVNMERGNRIILDETSSEDKLLEELREFRSEVHHRMEEQKKEYLTLVDKFVKAETELKNIRQVLEVVSEKASKVDLLEERVKSLLETNARLLASEKKELPPTDKELSFVNAVKKNITQVGAQKRGATKSAEKERTQSVNTESKSQNKPISEDTRNTEIQNTENKINTDIQNTENKPQSTPIAEDKRNTDNNETWTTVRRRSRYPNSEVKRGGSTNTTEIMGTEKQKFLHVWRLRKDTTVENLEKFIRGVVQEEPVKIEKIKHKKERDYVSFIIGISESKYDLLCQPEVWPLNVEFCEWVWFRRTANHPR